MALDAASEEALERAKSNGEKFINLRIRYRDLYLCLKIALSWPTANEFAKPVDGK